MKSPKTVLILTSMLLAATLQASAGVVYTQVNASIPLNSYYNVDLNRDGFLDLTFRSAFLQAYCESGDDYLWFLDVIPANTAGVMTTTSPGGALALALPAGVVVGPDDNFYSGTAIMAELFWGACTRGSEGQWLNVPDRYLGLRFSDSQKGTHYGWVKISSAAYVDESGHLQVSTFVSGFAYEAIAGQPILTGQISD